MLAPARTSQTWLRALRRPVSFLITDGDRIRSILTTLSAAQALGTIRAPAAANEAGFTERPEPVKLAPGPLLLVSPKFCIGLADFPWVVEFPGPYSLIRFGIEPTQRVSHGRFELPAVLECVYRRTQRRVSTPPGAQIRFLRPGSSDQWEVRALRDVSFGGLQFVAQRGDTFVPGDRLRSAHVTWKHGPKVPITATVRHVTDLDWAEVGCCGVSLTVDAADPARLWYDELSTLLHSRTVNATATTAARLWDLYDDSGYFALGGRSSDDYAHLKDDFARSSGKLADAPQLCSRIVSEHRGQIGATISLLQCWSSAWITYQIARRQEDTPLALSGNAILRDLFLHAYERTQLEPALRWHVSYVRFDARFSRLAYFDFAQARVDDQTVSIVPFRAIRVPCTYPQPIRTESVEVSCATPPEIDVILHELMMTYPVPYLEAYDFVRGRLTLNAAQEAWAAAGLTRRREILVAHVNGVPMAAAILDLVQSGIHLVGLLDSVHMVPLHRDGTRHFGALLDSARDWYSGHGKKNFVLFEENGVPEYALGRGAVDLGEANQIFFAASLIPEFLDHVSFVTAPRTEGGHQ